MLKKQSGESLGGNILFLLAHINSHDIEFASSFSRVICVRACECIFAVCGCERRAFVEDDESDEEREIRGRGALSHSSIRLGACFFGIFALWIITMPLRVRTSKKTYVGQLAFYFVSYSTPHKIGNDHLVGY